MATLNFENLLDHLQSPESLPWDMMTSYETLHIGDIIFVPPQHTLNMQGVSLIYLNILVADNSFQPEGIKSDVYSNTIAIFIVFLSDEEHQGIKHVHIILVVHHKGCHLYMQDGILPFVKSIEVDLKKVRDWAPIIRIQVGSVHIPCSLPIMGASQPSPPTLHIAWCTPLCTMMMRRTRITSTQQPVLQGCAHPPAYAMPCFSMWIRIQSTSEPMKAAALSFPIAHSTGPCFQRLSCHTITGGCWLVTILGNPTPWPPRETSASWIQSFQAVLGTVSCSRRMTSIDSREKDYVSPPTGRRNLCPLSPRRTNTGLPKPRRTHQAPPAKRRNLTRPVAGTLDFHHPRSLTTPTARNHPTGENAHLQPRNRQTAVTPGTTAPPPLDTRTGTTVTKAAEMALTRRAAALLASAPCHHITSMTWLCGMPTEGTSCWRILPHPKWEFMCQLQEPV